METPSWFIADSSCNTIESKRAEQQLEAGLEQQLEVGLEQQLEQVLVKLPELLSARIWKLGLVQQVMAEA